MIIILKRKLKIFTFFLKTIELKLTLDDIVYKDNNQ